MPPSSFGIFRETFDSADAPAIDAAGGDADMTRHFGSGGMRILAWPARRNLKQNPFNFLLSEALAGEGCDVVELDRRNSVLDRFDVFHIHWPEGQARGPIVQALGASASLLLRLLLQRLRGARIVWTVHNVNAHDQNNPLLERTLMRFVSRLVHGVIFLTASSRDMAYSQMPALASRPFAIIPHGLYGQQSRKPQAEARAAFGLPATAKVVAFLGDIRPYKGLDLLLDAYENTPPGNLTLFVAGAFAEKPYDTAIRPRLAALAAGNHSIVFREGRLDDTALGDAIRACDVVALPYRAAWNSGLALLVAENGGRILASDWPAFRELQQEVGPEQVRLFDGELTAEMLMAAAENAPATVAGCESSFFTMRSWPRIGAETVAFYRRLGAKPQSPQSRGNEP